MTTTLITGANKGLGFETARRLVAAGHTVYVGSRDPERGRRAAARVGARSVQLDVTDDASVTAAAKAIEALSNDFDTLVVTGADVHWRMHGRSSDSPLQRRHWEKVLGPLSSTSRNVKALTKLSDKIAARASG